MQVLNAFFFNLACPSNQVMQPFIPRSHIVSNSSARNLTSTSPVFGERRQQKASATRLGMEPLSYKVAAGSLGST